MRDELISILDTMDLPENRIYHLDFGTLNWLIRNIGIKQFNREHPKYDRAIELIKDRLKQIKQ